MRTKDQARILQFIESGAFDAEKLDEILKRNGLIAKWEEFSAFNERTPTFRIDPAALPLRA